MQQTILPGTALKTSRFIFGTASLFNAGPQAARHRLIDAVVDTGFTHFDTAPYYGFGIAERDLAPALRRHQNLTVTTKVGLYPAGGTNQPAALVLARKAAGRLLPALSKVTADWAVARARTALDDSLERLGRQHIELYLLHEPELPLLATDEWLGWLQREKSAGRIGSFGIALEAARLEPFLATKSPLADFVQTTDSLDDRDADILPRHGRPLQITYGYVSAAKAQSANVDVAAILEAALKRNTGGAIIVSTRRPERLSLYARLGA